MRLPRWFRSIPQPLRWALGGTITMAVIGAVYGLAESFRDYPPSSWFGVTLYVTMLGAIAGFLLGITAGLLSRIATTLSRRP